MKGADEYARIFETGQCGRFYFVSSSHARGATFNIYILPEGEKAIGNANSPLNNNAVEVYGIIRGNDGWSEEYGWLHKGKWVGDFLKLAKRAKALRAKMHLETTRKHDGKTAKENDRIKKLLATY